MQHNRTSRARTSPWASSRYRVERGQGYPTKCPRARIHNSNSYSLQVIIVTGKVAARASSRVATNRSSLSLSSRARPTRRTVTYFNTTTRILQNKVKIITTTTCSRNLANGQRTPLTCRMSDQAATPQS